MVLSRHRLAPAWSWAAWRGRLGPSWHALSYCRPLATRRCLAFRLQPPDQPRDRADDGKQEQHRQPDQRRADECDEEDAAKQRRYEDHQRKSEWSNATDIDAM